MLGARQLTNLSPVLPLEILMVVHCLGDPVLAFFVCIFFPHEFSNVIALAYLLYKVSV
jgi:hypothetical protein